MALVRARIRSGNKVRVKNMGRALAEASDNVEILEGEPTHKRDGTPLGITFESGRPLKPQTSVAQEAAKNKAVTASAGDKKENDQ